MLVGNEPFTKLVLRTAGDIVYILRCDEVNKHYLLHHQGKLAEIVFNEIQKARDKKEISVIGVKILSQSP